MKKRLARLLKKHYYDGVKLEEGDISQIFEGGVGVLFECAENEKSTIALCGMLDYYQIAYALPQHLAEWKSQYLCCRESSVSTFNDVVASLDSNLDILVVKGVAYESLFVNGYIRYASDIDVIVPDPKTYEQITARILADGYETPYTTLICRKAGCGICLTEKYIGRDNQLLLEIDLHAGYFPMSEVTSLDFSDLGYSPEIFSSHGVNLKTLNAHATALLYLGEMVGRREFKVRDALDAIAVFERLSEQSGIEQLCEKAEAYGLAGEVHRLHCELMELFDSGVPRIIKVLAERLSHQKCEYAKFDFYLDHFLPYSGWNHELMRLAKLRGWASKKVEHEKMLDFLKRVEPYRYSSKFFDGGIPIHFLQISDKKGEFDVREQGGYFVLTNSRGLYIGSLNAIFYEDELENLAMEFE